MIFGKRERSRTERTAALSFDEPKGKAHNRWRLLLMFSVGWVPPLTLPFQKLGVEGAPERTRLEKRHLLLDCFPSAARKDIFM